MTLSIPIFDNKRNKTNVQKARLNKMDSELQLQDQQKKLYSTVEEYWLNAYSNQQKYVAANAKLKSAQTSYELLDEQFKNGLKNIVELMNGRDELMKCATRPPAKQIQYPAPYPTPQILSRRKYQPLKT